MAKIGGWTVFTLFLILLILAVYMDILSPIDSPSFEEKVKWCAIYTDRTGAQYNLPENLTEERYEICVSDYKSIKNMVDKYGFEINAILPVMNIHMEENQKTFTDIYFNVSEKQAIAASCLQIEPQVLCHFTGTSQGETIDFYKPVINKVCTALASELYPKGEAIEPSPRDNYKVDIVPIFVCKEGEKE